MDPGRPDPASASFGELTTQVKDARWNVVLALLDRDTSVPTEQVLDNLLTSAVGPLRGATPAGGGWGAGPDDARAGDLDEIDTAQAHQLLVSVLHRDLAYDSEIVPHQRARELAAALLATIAADARWWTNGDIGLITRPVRSGPSGSWHPLTTATFDTGVIGIGIDHILIAWFMDED